jgi:sugar lactone lactonase YvrE
MNAISVTAWSTTPGLLSEGPRWDAERQELMWVDILDRQFHRSTVGADGGLGDQHTVTFDRHVGAVAPFVDGGFVLAAGTGFLLLDDAGKIHELAQPEAGRTDVRMNDGACDPTGRFWAGTMGYDEAPGLGSLYRLELDGDTMYLNDSGTGRLDAFRFDGLTGSISERRTLVEIEPGDGTPDGLTVDEEGGIWVALWGGGAVHRYAPDGSLLTRVPLAVQRPTSCAFGGPSMSTLFVTTAREGLDDVALAQQPGAGLVFAIDGLGVRGVPCLPYRGQDESRMLARPL